MPLTLADIQSLRQEYVGALDWLRAKITAEPGYSELWAAYLTQERWRIAGASERQGYLVEVGR